MNVVIIEDETPAGNRLARMLEKIDEGIRIIKRLDSVEASVKYLSSTPDVDLIFMDVQLADGLCWDIFQQARLAPPIVFTTAFDHYTLKAFKVNSLDYLLKPISFDRFIRAANKAFDYFRGQQVPAAGEDYIFVKADSRLEKIHFSDILFVEALENYVAIYTGEKKIITHLTLKMLQEKLPAGAFIQPHKSYIVAIGKINSIEGNILHVLNYQVPISKYQKEEIMEKIVNSKLLKR